ncbi:MAG: hypothetical protein RLZZ618_162 [Pseudomonadota bacterium]
MTTPLLDPWRDAAEIARRAVHPQGRLVIALGAEGWCQTCRDRKPAFEGLAAAHAQGAGPDAAREAWLWLDLEDHAEFLGDHVPEDLPWLLVYQGDALQTSALFDQAAIDSLSEPGRPAVELGPEDPGVRALLIEDNWAAR